MIDKNERKYFRGTDIQSVFQSLSGTLYQWGIQLEQTGQNTWTGKGTAFSYGMAPKVMLSLTPMQDGFSADVRVSTEFKSESLVIFVVAWLFFFPVALLLAFLGYQDFQTRQTQLFQALWYPVGHLIAAPPGPQWMAPTGQGAPPNAPPG